ncbi:transmembrane and death domain protein 1-like [Pimephales promelas]|uniref:transmembrane and death domain protein 1-like n=1 Tax=Pimephales promelas TaxID=90988 RepID=UPI001955B242|nr:transmembrane and death domain protein 1-like [Pimephales promelas]KAG1960977.1 hypothetical protein F2P79_005297 [Pimephales promelas]
MRESVLIFFLLLFFSPSLAYDTVAEDIGPHQLERLVELLTDRECEEFISAMTQPEDNIFQHLERLSAERNQLLQSRRRRHTGDQKPPCRSALKDWLQIHGKQIYYDRLSRALQQIGRTDIAIEVGKNINQDKTLAIQRYVEGYHELVSQMEKNQAENHDDRGKVSVLCKTGQRVHLERLGLGGENASSATVSASSARQNMASTLRAPFWIFHRTAHEHGHLSY